MSEVFGDKSEFAIEAGVEPHLEGSSQVWGHMCIWCRGKALGDVAEEYCGLANTCHNLKWLASHLDELWEPELAELNDFAAFELLDGINYGFQGESTFPMTRCSNGIGLADPGTGLTS